MVTRISWVMPGLENGEPNRGYRNLSPLTTDKLGSFHAHSLLTMGIRIFAEGKQ
jgi:hypothetical protein